MDSLAADLRYALRIFRRSPGSTATAVVSLAVGIAAATGLFSIVNAALLNPFPFADANRIVRLDMVDRGRPRGLFVTTRQLVALQHGWHRRRMVIHPALREGAQCDAGRTQFKVLRGLVLAGAARRGRSQILSSLVFARIPHFDYRECECHAAESELWN